MRTLLSLLLCIAITSCNAQAVSDEKKAEISEAILTTIKYNTYIGKPKDVRDLKIVKLESLTEQQFMTYKLERYTDKVISGEEHLAVKEDMVSTIKRYLEDLPEMVEPGDLDSAIANKLRAEEELKRARYSLDSFQKIVNVAADKQYGYMVAVTYDILSDDGKQDDDKDTIVRYLVTNDLKVSTYIPPYKP